MSDLARTTPLDDHFARTAGPRLLSDVQTLTRRCEPCWGTGVAVIDAHHLGDGVWSMDEDTCAPCGGSGRVPLKVPRPYLRALHA